MLLLTGRVRLKPGLPPHPVASALHGAEERGSGCRDGCLCSACCVRPLLPPLNNGWHAALLFVARARGRQPHPTHCQGPASGLSRLAEARTDTLGLSPALVVAHEVTVRLPVAEGPIHTLRGGRRGMGVGQQMEQGRVQQLRASRSMPLRAAHSPGELQQQQ